MHLALKEASSRSAIALAWKAREARSSTAATASVRYARVPEPEQREGGHEDAKIHEAGRKTKIDFNLKLKLDIPTMQTKSTLAADGPGCGASYRSC